MNQAKYDEAVAFVRDELPDATKAELRALFAANPDWYVPYHLRWGMDVRNWLRTHGFDERSLDVWNLDEVYIPLIRAAIQP